MMKNVSGETKYRILTSQPDKAKELIEKDYADKIREINQFNIVMAIEEEDVSKIIALLATNGIIINGASKCEVSLEEAFMNATVNVLLIMPCTFN